MRSSGLLGVSRARRRRDREGGRRHPGHPHVVATAIGGLAIAETVEGRQRYPIAVRYARGFRDDPRWLERVLVAAPSGAQVARITFATGPPMIRSEDGRLVGYVFVDPGERPLGAYVEEARRAVAERVTLPSGVRIEWAGQFQHYKRAKDRLQIVVPVTLFLIVLLLYLNTRSGVEVRHRAARGALLADRRCSGCSTTT
jgi:Cu(I)/Ag(I) efflux system membrane protein CusA/SilA